MKSPTFKLDGIIKGKNQQENFEGPLVLILQLLSKNKIEIRDIQISLILEQYLDYLDRMEQADLEITSEFVVMASQLVYIKARMLLDTEEEIDELSELIASLETLKCRETYSQIKGVTETLCEAYKLGSGLCVKPQEALPEIKLYQYTHDKSELSDAIIRALSREDQKSGVVNVNGIVVPKMIVYSVAEKSQEIIKCLASDRRMHIRTLFQNAKSRTELVAAFLSVLELCKDGGAFLEGDEEDPVIIKIDSIEEKTDKKINSSEKQEEFSAYDEKEK